MSGKMSAPELAAVLSASSVTVLPGTNPKLKRSWFVHGMLEDDRCWLDLVAALNPPLALLPHFPWSAHGASDWGRQAEGHQWIGEFADQQPLPGLMVAHSYGSNALLEYLLLHPAHQPEVLVLIAPFYRASRSQVEWETFLNLAHGLEPLLAESITIQDKRGRYAGWLLDNMVQHLRDRLGVYGWVEFLKLFLRAPDLDLTHLDCPTLIISGANDAYSLVQTNAELAANLPNAHHVCIPATGHFPHITHAAQVASLIQDFVITSGNPTNSQKS